MVTSLFGQMFSNSPYSIPYCPSSGDWYSAIQNQQAGAFLSDLQRSLGQAGTMPARHLTEVERHGESPRESIGEFRYLIGKEIVI